MHDTSKPFLYPSHWEVNFLFLMKHIFVHLKSYSMSKYEIPMSTPLSLQEKRKDQNQLSYQVKLENKKGAAMVVASSGFRTLMFST